MIRTALPLLLALAVMIPMTARADEASPPSATAQLEAKPSAFKLNALPLGAGAGAAILSVPAALALGSWVGSLSNNLLLAALPAVAIFLALPPIAVVLAQWAVSNLLSPGSAKVSPALWATIGVQLLVLVGAIVLGVHGQNVTDAALLTLVEAIVLPGTSWTVMRLSAPPPTHSEAATAALEARFELPRVAHIKVASWTF